MNKQSLAMFLAALGLMAGSAGLLAQIHGRQRLGLPGVKTHPTADSIRLAADLPEQVLDYSSEAVEVGAVTKRTLPADTSFGFRRYKAPDGFGLELRVVLMGTDRTSLHKPQFCLTGQGWEIDQTSEAAVPIEKPYRYDLRVVKLIATRTENGRRTAERGVYVYWYVADDSLSASVSGFERMWSMADKLIRTGILQRWAYVSCLAGCAPGQEEATFDRLKKFLASAVPDFQLTPKPREPALSTRR